MTSARLTSPVRTLIVATGTAALLAVVPVTAGQAAPAPQDKSPSVAAANRQVNALQDKMDRATEAYDTARAQLEQSQQRADDLRHRAAAQQRKVNNYRARVAAFASAAYTGGSASQLSSLLESGSPQTFVDQVATLDQVSKNQRELLTQLVNAETTLKKQHQQIKAEVARQVAREHTLAKQKAAIEQDLTRWRAIAKTARVKAERRAAAAARAAAARRAREAAAQRVSHSTPAPREAPPPTSGAASGSAAAAVHFAYAQLGKPYVWGASGPNAYDCSGLTMASWAAGGVALPHSSSMQYSSGVHIPISALQPGDLVFFGSPIHHVGLYIGGGKMIHAPTAGEVVQIAPISIMPIAGAVRP